MSSLTRWMRMALILSKESPHPSQRMAAIIVKGGSVLSGATNGKRLGRHAEIRALSKCSKSHGARIYIARMGGGQSKPCSLCLDAIISRGIETVSYITDTGHETRFKPLEIPLPIKRGWIDGM